MGFFEQIFGTDLSMPARAVVALVLVLALIALTVWLMRRFGEGRISGGAGRGRQQRLAVLDSASVDARRRLVLIRRDNVEHLLIIGGPTDVVIEPNIVRAAPPAASLRAAARPSGYEQGENEASIVPFDPHEPAGPIPAPPPRGAGDPSRTMPRSPQRVDPQYADMAQRLEAALRQPAQELEAARPAPQPRGPEPRTPEPRTPEPRAPEQRAPEPRAPEPRVQEQRPATPPAPTPRAPTPRVPEPRAPEPRAAEAPRAPEPRAKPAQPAPSPAQQSAADIFGSLEEEMASLLRPGAKKDNK